MKRLTYAGRSQSCECRTDALSSQDSTCWVDPLRAPATYLNRAYFPFGTLRFAFYLEVSLHFSLDMLTPDLGSPWFWPHGTSDQSKVLLWGSCEQHAIWVQRTRARRYRRLRCAGSTYLLSQDGLRSSELARVDHLDVIGERAAPASGTEPRAIQTDKCRLDRSGGPDYVNR